MPGEDEREGVEDRERHRPREERPRPVQEAPPLAGRPRRRRARGQGPPSLDGPRRDHDRRERDQLDDDGAGPTEPGRERHFPERWCGRPEVRVKRREHGPAHEARERERHRRRPRPEVEERTRSAAAAELHPDGEDERADQHREARGRDGAAEAHPEGCAPREEGGEEHGGDGQHQHLRPDPTAVATGDEGAEGRGETEGGVVEDHAEGGADQEERALPGAVPWREPGGPDQERRADRADHAGLGAPRNEASRERRRRERRGDIGRRAEHRTQVYRAGAGSAAERRGVVRVTITWLPDRATRAVLSLARASPAGFEADQGPGVEAIRMTNFWRDVVMASIRDIGQKGAAVLPGLVAMVTLLGLGALLAWMAQLTLMRLARVVDFDRRSQTWGLTLALGRAGIGRPPSQILGLLAFWGVFVIVATMGIEATGVPGTAGATGTLIQFIPRLVTGVLILVVGWLAANFVGQAVLIAAVNAGVPEARLVARAARWAVLLFAFATTLTHLGIGKDMIMIAFGTTFGGVVLALAIAFGLGGRGLAREALERRLRRPREPHPRETITHL